MAQKNLIVDANSPYLKTDGMKYREFPSKYNQIRNYATIVAFDAPANFKMKNLLEQQVGEIIKNAIVHGNSKDANKKVRIWWRYDKATSMAHIVVEDEGAGFQNLEQWNEFNKERTKHFMDNNFDEMLKFVSYRTNKSTDLDGGNAMFAAIEFWNGGLYYNTKRNKVACVKFYNRDDD